MDPAKTPRRYKLVNNQMRHELLQYIVDNNMSNIDAAQKTGINYENAKAIFRIYRNEARQTKKSIKFMGCTPKHL